MGAAFGATGVGEALLDAIGERLEKFARRRRPVLSEEPARPALELPLRIGVAPLDRGQEVRQLVW